MDQEKLIENKKADKAAGKKFLLLLIVSFVGGGIIGFGSMWIRDLTLDIGEVVMRGINRVAPYGTLSVGTVFFIWIGILFSQAKKIYQSWDREDEEVLNRCEIKLTYALILTNFCVIMNFFFMGAGFYSVLMKEDASMIIPFIFLVIGIFYDLTGSIIAQKKIINMEKELNPEKQGSVYDMKFHKVWIKSCDEAERLQIYKCAYKAFRVTQSSFIVVWLFCFIGMIVWDFGIMPMTVVLVLWAITVGSYQAEAVRLSKNPSEIMK